MEPCLAEEILHGLVATRSANPLPKAFALDITGEALGLHVEPHSIATKCPGEKQFGAEPRRVNIVLLKTRRNPIEQTPGRPFSLRIQARFRHGLLRVGQPPILSGIVPPRIPVTETTNRMLRAVRAHAEQSGRFAETTLDGTTLRCRARDAEEEAWYLLEADDDAVVVSLVTPDRWLSESIEADLMHNGDTLEELIEEELIELDGPAGTTHVEPVAHFRSDDFRYTFRSRVPDDDEETALRWLLAYEAAFHELGNMSGPADD
jgi:hypothetical protein